MNKGMLIIISGPSGSGKGTVVKELCLHEDISLSISYTTRTKRPEEIDGDSYFFISEDEFREKLDNDEFLESALFVGNYYATPKSFVVDKINNGKTVILEIEVNGAIQVKEKFSDCVLIFLVPPTIDILKQRLIDRQTESDETIERRLLKAKEEIKLIEKYDYLVINNKIEKAVEELKTIIKSEKLKPIRCQEEIKLISID